MKHGDVVSLIDASEDCGIAFHGVIGLLEPVFDKVPRRGSREDEMRAHGGEVHGAEGQHESRDGGARDGRRDGGREIEHG